MCHNILRQCSWWGCKKLVHSGRCVKHKKIKATPTQPREREPFYHTHRWRKLSEAYLARHPWCRQCEREGKKEAAKVTDHITPIRQGGDKWAADNRQPLCERCHARKSSAEGRGKEAKKINADGSRR